MWPELQRLLDVVLQEEEEGEFHPLFLCGLVLREDRESVRLFFRLVADESLLSAVLHTPRGRQWLLDAVGRACDGLKPPDDRPKDVQYRRFLLDGDPPSAA